MILSAAVVAFGSKVTRALLQTRHTNPVNGNGSWLGTPIGRQTNRRLWYCTRMSRIIAKCCWFTSIVVVYLLLQCGYSVALVECKTLWNTKCVKSVVGPDNQPVANASMQLGPTGCWWFFERTIWDENRSDCSKNWKSGDTVVQIRVKDKALVGCEATLLRVSPGCGVVGFDPAGSERGNVHCEACGVWGRGYSPSCGRLS